MDVDKILKTIGGIVVLALVIVIAVYIVHGLIWLFCTVLYYISYYAILYYYIILAREDDPSL